MGEVEAPNAGLGFAPVAGGITRAQRRHGQHPLTQDLVGRVGEVSRIDPTRIRHDQGRDLAQLLFEAPLFEFEFSHSAFVNV